MTLWEKKILGRAIIVLKKHFPYNNIYVNKPYKSGVIFFTNTECIETISITNF